MGLLAESWRLRTPLGDDITVSGRSTGAAWDDRPAPPSLLDLLADARGRRALLEMYGLVRGHDPSRHRPLSCEQFCRAALPALDEALWRGALGAHRQRTAHAFDDGRPGSAPSLPASVTSDGEPWSEADAEPRIELAGVEAPRFVPVVETVEIRYRILGPLGGARRVDLAVASAREPDRVIARVRVPGPYAPEAPFVWDGRADVAGGFIGLRGSPFLVWFILESASGRVSESGRGRVGVELGSVDLVVGARAGEGADVAEREAVRSLAEELEANGMPGPSHGRLVIESPVFMTHVREMNDWSSFYQYQLAHGDGYRIPLHAQLWLKAKDGTRKRSARATTGTRVLWRVRLPDETGYDGALAARGVAPRARIVLKRAAGHEAAASHPPGGFGAAYSVGGKKLGPTPIGRGDRRFYFESASPAWGFQKPDNRPWDAFSLAGQAGDPDEGEVGILFRGGRLAGERYDISAIVDLDHALDVADDSALDAAPAAQRSNALTIDVWRRVSVVRHLTVGSGTTAVDLVPVAAELAQAALVLDAAPGVVVEEVQARWSRHYRDLIERATAPFLKHALLPDPGDHPVRFRQFADYWQHASADAGFFGRLWERFLSFFGAGEERTYRQRCDAWSLPIYSTVIRGFRLPDGGMTVVKFGADGEHDQQTPEFVAGIAPPILGLTSRTKAVFFVFSKENDPGLAVHEIGHTLFLAHAPGHFDPGRQPGGYQPGAHDPGQICLMSYHPAKRHLCGYCFLKLAGWNPLEINPDGSLRS